MKNRLTFIGLVAITLLGVLIIVHFSTVANSAQNATPTFATSRFMLFSGTYQVESGLKKSSPTTTNGVFRIDTYTGNTWMLNVIETPDGNRSEQWQLIQNPPVK